MSRDSDLNEVVGHLCEWFAAAVGRLQRLDEHQGFVGAMLGHLETRLLSISESTQGRNQALSYIYALHLMYWEEKEDWERIAEIGYRAIASPAPSAVSRAHDHMSLGDALVKLGRVDEAASIYLSGLKDQLASAGHVGDIGSLLLLLSHVVPGVANEVLSEVSYVVSSHESLNLSHFSQNRSEASVQLKEAALSLYPKLRGSKLEEPRSETS